VNFFMMYDIDMHQVNLEQFRTYYFLDEISFKILFYFSFLK
jgi:hypothetical protein